jgi:hypothetical protein
MATLKAGNIIQAKTGTVARTNTTSKFLFTLPANAMVIGIRTFGAAPDNAQTLTLESRVGDSTSVATFATVAVGTTAVYNNDATLSGIAYDRQSTPVYVTGKWAEATTNTSTSGGPFSVAVEYL